LEDYNEKVRICHPWPGIDEKLAVITQEEEAVLMYALMEGMKISFKWDRDLEPDLGRTIQKKMAATGSMIPAVVIGGSNAVRLSQAFKDMGREVQSLDCPGWTVSEKAVDDLIPKLTVCLSSVDPSVPIVLYCLDNSSFKASNADGDLFPFTKSTVDHKYHVVGDVAIAPFSILTRTLAQIDRILDICKGRKVFVLSPVPRYILKTCCDDTSHCANVCAGDTAAAVATKKLLRDLAELNAQFSNKFSKGGTSFVATGDLLTGKQGCSKNELMQAMLSCWSTDQVHGDKLAYSKIAMGLLEVFGKTTEPRGTEEDQRTDPTTKKRTRAEDPDPDLPHHSRNLQRRDSAGSAYNSWPGENRRGRGGYGGAMGGNRRYF
jgi:hypothetical protein